MRSDHLLATVASIRDGPRFVQRRIRANAAAGSPQATPAQVNDSPWPSTAAVPSADQQRPPASSRRRRASATSSSPPPGARTQLQRTPIAVSAIDQNADPAGRPRTISANSRSIVPELLGRNDHRLQRRQLRDARRRPEQHHRLFRAAGGGAGRRFRHAVGADPIARHVRRVAGRGAARAAGNVVRQELVGRRGDRPDQAAGARAACLPTAQLSYGSFGHPRTSRPRSTFRSAISPRCGSSAGYEKSDGYYKNQACYGPVTGFVPSKFVRAFRAASTTGASAARTCSTRASSCWSSRPPTSRALFQYEILRDRSDTVPSVNENRALRQGRCRS